jgi:hypothetical protein
MSAVVAHDHVKQKGGEERVALHILDGLSAERLVTSLYDERSSIPRFSRHEVQTSFLQGVPAFRRDPRPALLCKNASPTQDSWCHWIMRVTSTRARSVGTACSVMRTSFSAANHLQRSANDICRTPWW